MRLGTAIERLIDNYRYASDKEWIQDKVAWALYYTWKEADDRKTENSSEKPNNCEDLQDWKDRMWAEAIVTEPTISKMEQVEDELQTNGYQTFSGTSVYVSRFEEEPQTDNGIDCSRCVGRFDCYDRDMPHAVRCNNYGKITDEPQTERRESDEKR